MHENTAAFHAWSDFYVIVGSSAAALTGLMFVVITLVAGVRARPTREGIAAFSTPTVVHFCAALVIAAALTAPWPTTACVGTFLAVGALGAIAYMIRVILHGARQSDYTPDWEDRVFYMGLPVAEYAVVLIAAIVLIFRPAPALFALAGVSLLLILNGIHNAWDVVVFVANRRLTDSDDAGS
jgi:hypothetical protein